MSSLNSSPNAKPNRQEKPRISRDALEVTALLLRQKPDADLETLFESLEDLIGLNTCLDRHVLLLRDYIKRGLKDAVRTLQPTAKELGGITRLEPRPRPNLRKVWIDSKERAEQKAAADEKVTRIWNKLVRDESLRLLDQVLPTGKTIGKTTIAEYALLGDIQAKLAWELQKLGPREALIEKVCTEERFRMLFDTCNEG